MKKIIKYLFLFLFNFNITLFCSNLDFKIHIQQVLQFKISWGLIGYLAFGYAYDNIKEINHKIKEHRENNPEDSKISSTYKVMSENKFNLYKSTLAIGTGLLASFYVLFVKYEDTLK